MERKSITKRVATSISNFTDDAHIVTGTHTTQKRVTDGKRVERVGKTSDTQQAPDFSTEGVNKTSALENKQNKPVPTTTGRGGYREGGGRPAGVPNKKTQELIDQVKATGQTPLDYLLSVMRDVKRPEEVRVDCAAKAAPYIHAKLSSTELSGKNGKPIPLAAVNIPTDPQAAADLYKTLMG